MLILDRTSFFVFVTAIENFKPGGAPFDPSGKLNPQSSIKSSPNLLAIDCIRNQPYIYHANEHFQITDNNQYLLFENLMATKNFCAIQESYAQNIFNISVPLFQTGIEFMEKQGKVSVSKTKESIISFASQAGFTSLQNENPKLAEKSRTKIFVQHDGRLIFYNQHFLPTIVTSIVAYINSPSGRRHRNQGSARRTCSNGSVEELIVFDPTQRTFFVEKIIIRDAILEQYILEIFLTTLLTIIASISYQFKDITAYLLTGMPNLVKQFSQPNYQRLPVQTIFLELLMMKDKTGKSTYNVAKSYPTSMQLIRNKLQEFKKFANNCREIPYMPKTTSIFSRLSVGLHNILILPTAADLLNKFYDKTYLLMDYQAVTAIFYNEYWKKPNSNKFNQNHSPILRFVLVDNYIANSGGEIEEFARELARNWHKIELDTRIQLLIRGKGESSFSGHWFLYDMQKITTDQIYVIAVDSLENSKAQQKTTSIFQKNLGTRFIYNSTSHIVQNSYGNCAAFAIDAAFRMEKFAFDPVKQAENTQFRNVENSTEIERLLSSEALPNKERDYLQKHSELVCSAENNQIEFVNNGIEHKRLGFLAKTRPFLDFLVRNPKYYDFMLEARKGIKYLTTGLKPNWSFLLEKNAVDPRDLFDYFVWQFNSWGQTWAKVSVNATLQSETIKNFTGELIKQKSAIIEAFTQNSGLLFSKYKFCQFILAKKEASDNLKNLIDKTGASYAISTKSPREKLLEFLQKLELSDRQFAIDTEIDKNKKSEATIYSFWQDDHPLGAGSVKTFWCN